MASTDPSISTAFSAPPAAAWRGRMRRRNAARCGQATPRSASTPSSSATVKGGNAPGKLDVARAAKANSGSGASVSTPAPPSEKAITIRCSVSSTSAGELIGSRSGWPVKSVTVTNRSSGWPSGSSRGPRALAAIASSASSSSALNPAPPNGGSNQRERTKWESLARTSSRVAASASSSTAAALRPAAIHAIGSAHSFDSRVEGAASDAISASTSADSSHRSVSGSSDWPVAIACARNTPLIAPADAPATMSASTRSRVPVSAAIPSSSAW